MYDDESASNFEFNASTLPTEASQRDSNVQTHGRYKLLFPRPDNKHLFIIGPHWYISIIGQLLVFSVGVTVLVALWSLLTVYQILLYFAFFLTTIGLYFGMFVSDPGILAKNRMLESFDDVETKTRYTCKRCLAVRADEAMHCDDCGICIIEHDHHCIWIGKCVGKNNLRLFYAFVASVPTFFVFVMFLSVWVTSQKITHAN